MCVHTFIQIVILISVYQLYLLLGLLYLSHTLLQQSIKKNFCPKKNIKANLLEENANFVDTTKKQKKIFQNIFIFNCNYCRFVFIL